jgi:Mg-chelatase subunit ChlD
MHWIACLRPLLCTVILLAGRVSAQDDAATEASRECASHVASAIRLWCEDYGNERLGPYTLLREGAGLQPRYAESMRRAHLLEARDYGRLNHLEELQKLLVFAEAHGDATIADAVLDLAAAGFDKSLVDRDARMLRDLGHWSLMRMSSQSVWFLLMRAAAGERLPFLQEDHAPANPIALRQVAALKCLGMKGAPLYRSTIEGQLGSGDPRVRLAAVEAIEFQHRAESLGVLERALGSERHPVVAPALARTLLATLQACGDRLDPDERERAVRAALRGFGQSGWRTDLELIDLVERFPCKSAIPELISVLERTTARPDKLVELVNKEATPRLRQRAHEVLHALTGALLPANQPAQWRQFWDKEQDNIRVPERIGRFRDDHTRAEFFGIPVTGREVAFLIDVSGSMKEPSGTATPRGRRDAVQSRLEAAKAQLLTAVQSMDPQAMKFHLIAFNAGIAAGTREPVKPDSSHIQALHSLLGRLQADGGTDIFEALTQALSLEKLRYGQAAPSGIDEVFLLTDGMPTVGLTDPDKILDAIAAANRYLKVRIHTVFTGTGTGADFLKKLAEQNDGVFVQR